MPQYLHTHRAALDNRECELMYHHIVLLFGLLGACRQCCVSTDCAGAADIPGSAHSARNGGHCPMADAFRACCLTPCHNCEFKPVVHAVMHLATFERRSLRERCFQEAWRHSLCSCGGGCVAALLHSIPIFARPNCVHECNQRSHSLVASRVVPGARDLFQAVGFASGSATLVGQCWASVA